MRGLLSGIGLDFRDCEYILGTSAGSIVAATLVSGRELDAGDRATRVWDAPSAPAPRFGLARAAARAASPRPQRTLGRLGHHLDTLGATFDGRLRVAAVDRGSGARVLFGAPGAPTASVRDAVLASCA